MAVALQQASSSSMMAAIPSRNRALPPLPIQPGGPQPRPRVRSTDSVNTYRPRAISSLTMPQQSRRSLTFIAQCPAVLDRLLLFLPWTDFLPLANTCRDYRYLLRDLPRKDIVLSRFVAGYAQAIRERDLQRYRDVKVSIHDLDLLLISQRHSLHHYPLHALACLSSLLPSPDQEERSAKLVALTQAHSRFVLLLQAIVHSSSLPVAPEPSESPSASLRPSAKCLQRPSPTIRELSFPAPLSYQERYQSAQEPSPPRPRFSRHRLTSTHQHHRRHASESVGDHTRSLTSKARRRLSQLVNPVTSPPPPPTSRPRALKEYTSTWRRSNQIQHARRASDSEQPAQGSHFRFATVPEHSSDSSTVSSLMSSPSASPARTTPEGSPTSSASESGGAISPISLDVSGAQPHELRLATSRTRAPVLRVFVPCAVLSSSLGEEDESFHEGQGPSTLGSIQRCEDQLVDANLWDHLSVGDVVCNLGYVPQSRGPSLAPSRQQSRVPLTSRNSVYGGAASSAHGIDAGLGLGLGIGDENAGSLLPTLPPISPPSPSISFPQGDHISSSQQQQTWLVFNGVELVPYVPPGPPPIPDPLSLPSPFYYAHLIPSSDAASSAHPVYVLDRLPRFVFPRYDVDGREILGGRMNNEGPHLELVRATRRVRSPHSAGGHAVVKRHVWIARVRCIGGDLAPPGVQPHPYAEPEGADIPGEGWLGEWTLECEGTPEGRQTLLRCLESYQASPHRASRSPRRAWELVRFQSGGGRLWFRLLSTISSSSATVLPLSSPEFTRNGLTATHHTLPMQVARSS
ncbi:hypothetical protein HGRIS_003832 [Hohenbuehelia grisea]|uniref:F-box domain-containing protein n=1 Tax=Hohenbuehelia grisea TaxID=104357 RepID=A0ABR3JGJ4_9AGAR